MSAIRLADNSDRTVGEKALLRSGATFGPKFLGEPTIVIMFGPLKTAEGLTTLYRVVGRFHNAQATFDLDTMRNPDPTPILRTAEGILNKIRVDPSKSD